MLIVSVAVSGLIVAAWFPTSDLLHQRQQLAAASTQLHSIERQNQALSQEAKNLRDPSEIEHLAEKQYDLVQPGQTAYQVLPPSGAGNGVGLSTTAKTSASSRGTAASGADSSASGESGGFLHRILDTLEFWR